MAFTKIRQATAREILDSRGNPTVECTVVLEDGTQGRAAVPSGASTGQYEAHELRDGDVARYGGKGVLRAVSNIRETISPAIAGADATDTALLDAKLIALDGTENKSRLGANALLGVSLAAARAAANAYGMPLYRFLGGVQANTMPIPMMNILNGGAHASNNLDIQEFMILPTGANSFAEGLRWCAEVYHKLQGILTAQGLSTGVGDEGGFAPNLSGKQALDLMMEAIEAAGHRPGSDFMLAMDVAASEWVDGDGYLLPKAKLRFSTAGLIDHFAQLCEQYPICSIEDPLGENDFAGFSDLTSKLGGSRMIVGDDLFVTNPARLADGIRQKAANAILLKVNQIGTLTESLEAISMAKRAGYATILSHRSGETQDTFIADLSVAVNAGYIKSGAPCRTERVSKYNRLLQIEEELGSVSHYGLGPLERSGTSAG